MAIYQTQHAFVRGVMGWFHFVTALLHAHLVMPVDCKNIFFLLPVDFCSCLMFGHISDMDGNMEIHIED